MASPRTVTRINESTSSTEFSYMLRNYSHVASVYNLCVRESGAVWRAQVPVQAFGGQPLLVLLQVGQSLLQPSQMLLISLPQCLQLQLHRSTITHQGNLH